MTGIQVQQWIQHQVAQIETQCRAACGRIAQARDMRGVIHAMHVSVRPEVRAIQNTIPGLRRMKSDAEERLNAMLDTHLAEIRRAESAEEALSIKGRYQSRDWECLRGSYAHLYRRAYAESRAIVRTKELDEEES